MEQNTNERPARGFLSRVLHAVPYKRIIAMTLIVSLLSSILVVPVQASAPDPKREAATELLETVRTILRESWQNEPDTVSQADQVRLAAPKALTSQPEKPEQQEKTEQPEQPSAEEEGVELDVALKLGDQEITDIAELNEIRIETSEKISTLSFGEDGTYSALEMPKKLTAAPLGASPASDPTELNWDRFSSDTLYEIATFITTGLDKDGDSHNALSFPTKETDGSAQSYVFYTVAGCEELHDGNDFNGVCDVCGYCLDDCTDGKTQLYTEADIDPSKTKDGAYYNAAGDLIGRDGKVKVSYTDDNGVLQSREEYAIVFEQYTVGADGFCDVCNKQVCYPPLSGYSHDYSDGFCDGCGRCMAGCIDPADGICDNCKKTFTVKCETCSDGDDEDKLCDTCGRCCGENVTCKDDDKDGICDTCKFCTGTCVDDRGDGFCDVCFSDLSVPNICIHQDHKKNSGSQTCNNCKGTVCHISGIEINQATAYLSGIAGYLRDIGDTDHAEATDSYLSEVQKQSTIRQQIKDAGQYNRDMKAAIDTANAVTGNGQTGKQLIGTYKNGVLNTANSLLGNYYGARDKYLNRVKAVDEQAKSYYIYRNSFSSDPASFRAAAETILMREFDAVLGENYTGGAIEITNSNIFTLQNACDSVETDLIRYLYPADYESITTADDALAKKICDGEASIPAGTSQNSNTLRYKMVLHVITLINAFRENSYSDYKSLALSDDHVYATRKGASTDYGRTEGEDFVLTGAKIKSAIRSLDAFIASPEFFNLMRTLVGNVGGVDLKDVDSFYDLLLEILVKNFLNDELFSEIFLSLFPLVTNLVDDLPNILGGLLGESLESYIAPGAYHVDLADLIGNLTEQSWLYPVLDALGGGVGGAAFINGAGGPLGGDTRSIREILSSNEIFLFEDKVKEVIGKYNKNGKYDQLLKDIGNEWPTIEESDLPIKFDSVDGAKEFISRFILDNRYKELLKDVEAQWPNVEGATIPVVINTLQDARMFISRFENGLLPYEVIGNLWPKDDDGNYNELNYKLNTFEDAKAFLNEYNGNGWFDALIKEVGEKWPKIEYEDRHFEIKSLEDAKGFVGMHNMNGKYGVLLLDIDNQWPKDENGAYLSFNYELKTIEDVRSFFNSFNRDGLYNNLINDITDQWPQDDSAQLPIEIKRPKDAKSFIGRYNTGGKYDDLIKDVEDKWFGDLHFGIETFEDAKEVLSILLDCVRPIGKLLFGTEDKKMVLDLSDLGYVTVSGTANIIILVLTLTISLRLNPYFESDYTKLYADVIEPIYEALGVSSFDAYPDLNYQFKPIVFTEVGDMDQAINALLDPLLAFVKQLSEHPLEKLLSIIPNLIMAMQNNKLLELFFINTEYTLELRDPLPSGLDFLDGYLLMLSDAIFPNWWDYLNPLKWITFLAATVQYWAFVGIFSLAMAIIGDIDAWEFFDMIVDLFDLKDSMNIPFDDLLSSIPDALNGALKSLTEKNGLKVKNGFTIAFPDVTINPFSDKDLFLELNLYRKLQELFISDDAKTKLHFDITEPNSFVELFADAIYTQDDQPLFDKETLVNAVNLNQLSTLGWMKKKTGSQRDQKYACRWNSLDPGEYFFIEASISDVFYAFMQMIAGVFGNEKNLQAILTLAGLNEEKINEKLAAADYDLKSSSGIALKSILADFLDENGNLTLHDICCNITPENLACFLCELFSSGEMYNLLEMRYKRADEERQKEYEEQRRIPYLKYENEWTEELADLATDDLDDLANLVIETFEVDLDEEKEGLETVQEFISEKFAEVLSGTEPLESLASGLVELGVELAESEQTAAIIGMVQNQVDLDAWRHDFAFLFRDDAVAPAPEDRKIPNLRAEKTADGIVWYYKEKELKDYHETMGVMIDLLTPWEPVIDTLLTGKSLKLLPYQGGGANLITITGGTGYNDILIPLMEALIGPDPRILTAKQFEEMGSIEGVVYSINLVLDRAMEICRSETVMADAFEMVTQLLYALAENGLSVIIMGFAHFAWNLIDTVRPVAGLDLSRVATNIICDVTYQFGGYASADEMRKDVFDAGAQLDLNNLSLTNALKFAAFFHTAVLDGKREYLSAAEVFESAMQDLACLRKSYDSKRVKTVRSALTEQSVEAYRLDISGRDALTFFTSLMLEIILNGKNAEILDTAFELRGLFTCIRGMLTGKTAYYKDFDWAYMIDGTEKEKEAFLMSLKESGRKDAEDCRTEPDQADFDKYLEAYERTDWSEEALITLVESLDDIITAILNLDSNGAPLAESILPPEQLIKQNGRYTLGSIVTGLLSDEIIEQLMELVAGLANLDPTMGFDEVVMEFLRELFPYLERLLHTVDFDLERYQFDPSKTKTENGKKIYYNSKGEPTGLEREVLAEGAENLGEILAGLFEPFSGLLAFTLLGKPIELFYASAESSVNGRGKTLVSVPGAESYSGIVLPMLEAMGCENLKPASYYCADGEYKSAEFEHDLMSAIGNRLIWLISDKDSKAILDKLLELFPPLIYLCNANGIGNLLKNLIAPFENLINSYNTFLDLSEGDASLKVPLETYKAFCTQLSIGRLMRIGLSWVSFSGVEPVDSKTESLLALVLRLIGGESFDTVLDSLLDTMLRILDGEPSESVLNSLLQFLSGTPAEEAGPEGGDKLCLTDFAVRRLNRFIIGELSYNEDSACEFDTYTMRFRDSADKAAFITILVSGILDFLENPDNEKVLSALFGEEIYQTMINLMDLESHDFEMKDFSWKMTEYADTDTPVSGFLKQESDWDEGVYGNIWTRERAAEMGSNMEDFVSDVLYLLGLEINGTPVRDFSALAHALINGSLYTDKTLNKLAAILGQIKPYLDQYDPTGKIAEFVEELLGVDLHAWDDYAVGGKYEEGREWGFRTEDSSEETVAYNETVFENALVELLLPVAPLLVFVLANRDFTLLVDGDGLGRNSKDIQLVICGAEGYKYAIVPLFEALHVDRSAICAPDEYSRRAVQSNDYAIRSIIHPLFIKLNQVCSGSAQDLFDALPGLFYFLNCGGLGTVVENLAHSVTVIGNALAPIKDQISIFVYDEQGTFDLFRTLNVPKLLDDALFSALGISEDDLIRIYEAFGGSYEKLDSFEDIDLQLIFSIGLAMVDQLLQEAGVNMSVTPLAADLVDELSVGYMKSFTSLNGRTAYTITLDQKLDEEIVGDFFTALVSLTLRFLGVTGNTDALLALLRENVDMSDDDYRAVRSVIRVITGYFGSSGGSQTAMLALYYVVYGASEASGAVYKDYKRVNRKWACLLTKLRLQEGPVPYAILCALLDVFKAEIGDIVTPTDVAPQGLYSFYSQIIAVLKEGFSSFTNLLKMLFRPIIKLFDR